MLLEKINNVETLIKSKKSKKKILKIQKFQNFAANSVNKPYFAKFL